MVDEIKPKVVILECDEMRSNRQITIENVFIINVMELTKGVGYDVITVDGTHLTDAGMLLVADAISEILSKELYLQCVK